MIRFGVNGTQVLTSQDHVRHWLGAYLVRKRLLEQLDGGQLVFADFTDFVSIITSQRILGRMDPMIPFRVTTLLRRSQWYSCLRLWVMSSVAIDCLHDTCIFCCVHGLVRVEIVTRHISSVSSILAVICVKLASKFSTERVCRTEVHIASARARSRLWRGQHDVAGPLHGVECHN